MSHGLRGAPGIGRRYRAPCRLATKELMYNLPDVDQPQPPDVPDRCDVLVIGGGPAGATISALLAERGHRVVVVEKDRHPRFHIGESLLPLNLPLFDRLGVRA